jgi:quercetin dioxygenase-like cupin family protein
LAEIAALGGPREELRRTIVTFYDLDKTPADAGTEAQVRKIARGEKLVVTRMELKRGNVSAPHSHQYEEVVIVLSGEWRFDLGRSPVTVRANQMICIPPGAEHFSETLEDTVALVVSTRPHADTYLQAQGVLTDDPDQYLWGV